MFVDLAPSQTPINKVLTFKHFGSDLGQNTLHSLITEQFKLSPRILVDMRPTDFGNAGIFFSVSLNLP